MAEERKGRFERKSEIQSNDSSSYSRWSGPSQKIVYLEIAKPIPTIIKNALTQEQIDAYVSLVRIEEISQMIKNGNIIPNDSIRSPSPPPIYDATGKRTNTREARYRKKLQTERNLLIGKALKTIPEYNAPENYRKPALKTTEKLYLPVKEHPEINFIGLLIGPRGNTLKHLQEQSGARIAIRGKGSVKEGRDKSGAAAHMQNMEDPLHCLIIAETEDKIKKAIKLCNEIIDKAIYAPVGQNDHKREQLKALAILNGTLRKDEDRICPLCHERGHKKYDCPNKNKIEFLQSLVCSKCGNVGHLEKDCRVGFNGGHGVNLMDMEFENMMKDLNGEDIPTPPLLESGLDQHQIQEQQQLENPPYISSLPPIPPSSGASGGVASFTGNAPPPVPSTSGSSYHQNDYNNGGYYKNTGYYNKSNGYDQGYNNTYNDGYYKQQSSRTGGDGYYKDPYYQEQGYGDHYSQRKRPYDDFNNYKNGDNSYNNYDQDQSSHYNKRSRMGSPALSGPGQSSSQPQTNTKPHGSPEPMSFPYGLKKLAGPGSIQPAAAPPPQQPQQQPSSYALRGPPGLKTTQPLPTKTTATKITSSLAPPPPLSTLHGPPGLSAPPGMAMKRSGPPPPPPSGSIKKPMGRRPPPPPPPPPSKKQ